MTAPLTKFFIMSCTLSSMLLHEHSRQKRSFNLLFRLGHIQPPTDRRNRKQHQLHFSPCLISSHVSDTPSFNPFSAGVLSPSPSSRSVSFTPVCLCSRTHPPGRALFAESTNAEVFKHPLPLSGSARVQSRLQGQREDFLQACSMKHQTHVTVILVIKTGP